MARRAGYWTVVGACALTGGGLSGCAARHAPPMRAAGAPLSAVRVEPRTTIAERGFDGIVHAVERATLSAQTGGRVAAIYHDVDQSVPAGTLLIRLRATIQRADLGQARAALNAARARATEADKRYRRIRALYEQRVVPKADFDQVTAARATAVASLHAARAALAAAAEGVNYTEIRAPFAGVVTARMVEVGEAVAPGTPLMRVASLTHLRVVASVPQSLAGTIRRLGKATVSVDGRLIEAAHVTVYPQASAGANVFPVRVSLPQPVPGLFPGMVVRVRFPTGRRTELLVPVSVIVRRSAVTAVYLVQPDGDTLLQQVRLGRRVGGQVAVLSGLTAGERVALNPLAAMRRLEPFPVLTGSAQ